MEETKRLLSEKNFRNKQERDRRVRELNSNNMKKFIDERKRLANKHSQETNLLAKMAKDEEDTLKDENARVCHASIVYWFHLCIEFESHSLHSKLTVSIHPDLTNKPVHGPFWLIAIFIISKLILQRYWPKSPLVDMSIQKLGILLFENFKTFSGI